MTLSEAYFLLAAIFAVPALTLFFVPDAADAFPRAKKTGWLLFGAAGGWFVFELTRLGEPDLAGLPRELIVGLFAASILAAFRLLPDFLGVRGLAGLLLLAAGPMLDAGFGKTPQSLLLASLTYALIFFAIVTGTAPYLVRDLIGAIRRTPARTRTTAGLFAIAAVASVANGILIGN